MIKNYYYRYNATNINYENDDQDVSDLPNSITLTSKIKLKSMFDNVLNYISDSTGYLVKNFDLSIDIVIELEDEGISFKRKLFKENKDLTIVLKSDIINL